MTSTESKAKKPWIPPRWFIRTAWWVHRRMYQLSGGRIGLWKPSPGKWGTLRLTTTGRRTGQERSVIVGYFEDGPNLVSMAMNGWGAPEPAWWLNLRANPEAMAELADEKRPVRARAATGEERSRLWARWCEIDPNYEPLSKRRPSETAIVVLEPRETA